MADNNIIILIILAAAAGFLLLRLRSILGTRTGFEDPEKFVRPAAAEPEAGSDGDNVVPMPQRRDQDDDSDIFAVTEIDSPLGVTLKKMKTAEPSFNVREFVEGSKGAYEMLLTAYESGDKETLQPFLSEEVFEAFSTAIDQRTESGLVVDMRFVGIRSAELVDATFDDADSRAEVTMKFVAEVITATRNGQGDIVQGDPQAVQRLSDRWTFAREMGSDDPNWTLIATGG